MVCLQCIDSTRGHVVNADGSRSAVVICPQCVKIFGGNSNWTTPEKLLNCANEIVSKNIIAECGQVSMNFFNAIFNK